MRTACLLAVCLLASLAGCQGDPPVAGAVDGGDAGSGADGGADSGADSGAGGDAGAGNGDDMAAPGCGADLMTDAKNCGRCGNACAAAHATAVCRKGSCALDCDPGFLHCSADPADGCEVDGDGDVNNCGACGRPCGQLPNATPSCVKGACGIMKCGAPYWDCNGDLQDGCEADLSRDPLNCGGCGTSCRAPNSTPACVQGNCAIGGCAMGFADCDLQAGTGCEVDTRSDIANCGGCGTVCAVPANAAPSCSMGTCGATCKPGFGDCNKKPGDGCEVDWTSDVGNCGQCGAACAAVANGTPGCAAGKCGIAACTGTFADCDLAANNGCEINVASDVKNCSRCGAACLQGQSCVAGTCRSCNNAVLILGDNLQLPDALLVAAVQASGMKVTLVADGETSYAGQPAAAGFGAVVVLLGEQGLGIDMPLAGQQAIVAAAGISTGVVLSEWAAWQRSQNLWNTLAPLVLLQRTGQGIANSTLTFTLEKMGHAIWAGLPNSFATVNVMGGNTGGNLLNGGTRIAGCAECQGAGVVVRDNGAGRIVQLAHAANWRQGGIIRELFTVNDPNTTRMFVNAVQWAAKCL